MKRENLGELEELVLLTVGMLLENAYALNILEELQNRTNRNPDVTAIHSVLRRLENKGFLKSEMGGATAERGGRRKRYFSLTHAGKAAVENSMSVKMDLYNMWPNLSFDSL